MRGAPMKNASVALPRLSKIEAALSKTTEILASEVAVPTSEPPIWTEFEWRIARAVAAMHGVSSLLFDGLRWEGAESWRRFLHEQRDQSFGRYLQMASLLKAIDSQARCDGIALVALKGAALHALGIYAGGQRPMGDIDLLVRDDDAKGVARLLESCGYEIAFTSRRHQVFQPQVRKIPMSGGLGEHIDNPLKIEVHTRILEHLPIRTVDITQFLFPRLAHAGINRYSSSASLMLHLLLHAAGNIRARALRLIQLHDIALLAARFDPGDWEQLFAASSDGHTLWWALAPLMLAARYYRISMPASVLERMCIGCPRRLSKRARRQRLTDVSWSNIRIEAFPGLEWSRSLGEAVEFMSSRIWPSRDARLELKEGAAQIPGSSTVPWYGLPHAVRILRWAFSRPPRVQTMLSVRAALAHKTATP